MMLGAQMYTVRQQAKNPAEIDAAFAKLKTIGYSAVQVSGLGPISPEELRNISQKYNLPVTLTHTDAARMLTDTQKVIDEHRVYGCHNIGIGSMPAKYRGSLAGFMQFAADYAPVAQRINDNGMRFHYHNHNFEFETLDGKCGFDALIEATAKEDWHFILDTYWVEYAGKDLLSYISKLKGRLTHVHLKDMQVLKGERTMAPVGAGSMHFADILPAFATAGTECAYVEQDNASEFGDPFAQLSVSYENLKKLGWK